MKFRPLVSVALLAALAACGTSPQSQVPQVAPTQALGGSQGTAPIDGLLPDGQVYPTGNTFRLLAVEELPIVEATASSSRSGNTPSRAIDGDLATQWVDGGYRNATSWLAVQLAAASTIASIEIKTGPSPAGTSYDVQVSNDGISWTAVRTGLTNTSWNQETKTLPAGTTGKYVRIVWKNSTSSPQAHFAIYEMTVNGERAGMPSPTPTVTPSMTPSVMPTATPTTAPSAPSESPVKVTPTAVTASSTYADLAPQRATDGNMSTQWANGGYKDAGAWLSLAFTGTQTFSSIRIKTGALPAGVSYVVEISNDGTNWTAASGSLTNTTWNLESKAISGQGKFLRVRFTNSTSNPIARFSVYEVEAYAASAQANRAPTLTGITQSPMQFDFEGDGGTLTAQASDPDGDTLTYSWQVRDGQIQPGDGRPLAQSYVGLSSPTVKYVPSPHYPPSDDQVTLTVTDSKGATATSTFKVAVADSAALPLNAADALEWDPAKAAYAQLSGDVTVQAGGDFSWYNAVICEYSTSSGREMALLMPGTSVLKGVTGNIYMYLIGQTERGDINPEIPAPNPNVSLTLSAGGQTVNRTITNANLVGSNHVGLQIYSPSNGGAADYLVGENTAKNGPNPYRHVLRVYTSPYWNPDARISYSLHTTGDVFSGYYDGSEDCRLLLTDSIGGTGDNTGSWIIYERDY